MAESLALVWDLIARDNASGTFRKVGAEAEGASGAVGKLLGGFTALAVGGAIAASTKAAADFQAKMLLVQTQAGATSDEVRKMSPAILSLAGQVAQAPEALATSLYHVESTGLRGAQALEAVKVAAEGARVGHADLEQTTNALTATIASGMLPATETYAQAMGQLNTIVGSGDMKMQDLNDALASGLLVVTKQYGVGINDVGAALATFGDNNIRGADAATMLRMAVQSIQTPGKNAASELERIGLTVQQLQSDEQTGGLNKALTDLHDHLVNSGIDASQWGELLTNAFTKKAGSGLITLIGQFDRFQTKYEEVSKGADSFGNAWEATTKTANFQFAALGNSMEALGIRIGTAVLPYVTDLAKHVNEFVNSQGFKNFLDDAGQAALTAGHAIGGLVQGFMDLPGPIKDVAYALALLKLADYVGVTEKLSAGIGSMKTAFAGFREESALQQSLWAMNQRSAIETGRAYGDMEHALGGFGLTAEAAGAGATGLEGKLGTLAVRGMSGLKAAGSGVMNMLGGPWGVALLGATAVVGVLEASIQHGEETTKSWTEALKQGGDAADKARLQMDQTNATLEKLNSGATGFGTKLLGLNTIINSSAGNSKEATQNYNDWYNSLGLVDQKTQDLQLATAHLNEVLKTHAASSLEVRDAVNAVRVAQQGQTDAQNLLNNATKTALQLSQEQAQADLGMVGSALAVKQSYDEFNTSLQQYQADLKGGKTSAADLTREQDALNNQTISVAQSAGAAGAAWAKANGITDTATASQYGQLLALEKVAQAMGKDTPAAVTTLIGSLSASVAQGHLTQQQMDGITAAVDGIPGQKKIDVTADTSQAQTDLNGLITAYQHVQYTGSSIVVNGRVIANAEGNLLEAYASGGMSPMSSSVAQVVQPGTLRVIGDNPVADEAFIPINNSSRSMTILGETANRMGMGLVAMANGGMFPDSSDQFTAQPSQSMLDTAGRAAASIGQSVAQAVASSAGGAARWAPLVDQVLAMLGISRSAEAGVLSLINSESGGNPNAINLWDSNAKAGHPSQGLMQTIPGTFARWRNPSLPNNILDPLANIYAGVNYALHTYGAGMLMGGGRHGAGGGYIGYETGTNYVPNDGPAYLHKGEAVIPAAINAQLNGGATHITLQLDRGAVTDLLDGRVVTALTAVADRGEYSQ